MLLRAKLAEALRVWMEREELTQAELRTGERLTSRSIGAPAC